MLFFSRLSIHSGRPNALFFYYQQRASFVEGAKIKWIRDRGLDHAVEKEKNLRPLLCLKNLIISEPSKSLPLSLAADMKTQLALPTRAIKFVRKYPSVFLELPSSDPAAPHRPRIGLTPDSLRLHDEERSLYHSCKQNTADRLLKLLMLTPEKKLPLPLVERLKFDLGLPDDYARSILPDFPDYFLISPLRPGDNTLALELVCWSKELAVSVMEKSAASKGEYKKGMPLAFPLQYSRGFDMEKKVKRWVDEWQKLPYISPYEDGTHLAPKSDLGEKWAVGVLHEILHLLVSKKTDKENLLFLGEYMGLRSRFKRALADHPGIFYVSNKIRMSTIVLREAYKRDLLVVKHPLMGMRYHYIHLMNMGKDMSVAGPSLHGNSDKKAHVKAEEEDEDDDEDESGEEEDEEEGYGSSDSEDEGETDSDDEDEQEPSESVLVDRGAKRIGRRPIEMKGATISRVQGRSIGRHSDKSGKVPTTFSRKTEMRKGPNTGIRSPGRPSYPRSGERRFPDRRNSTY